jgi:hypothetical protein
MLCQDLVALLRGQNLATASHQSAEPSSLPHTTSDAAVPETNATEPLRGTNRACGNLGWTARVPRRLSGVPATSCSGPCEPLRSKQMLQGCWYPDTCSVGSLGRANLRTSRQSRGLWEAAGGGSRGARVGVWADSGTHHTAKNAMAPAPAGLGHGHAQRRPLGPGYPPHVASEPRPVERVWEDHTAKVPTHACIPLP